MGSARSLATGAGLIQHPTDHQDRHLPDCDNIWSILLKLDAKANQNAWKRIKEGQEVRI